MKKIVFILMCLFTLSTMQAQYVKVDNNTFQQTSTKSEYKPTGKYYIDKNGVQYEIYLHTCTRGSNAGKTFCYIRKTSKSGKQYWQKIAVKPEEL